MKLHADRSRDTSLDEARRPRAPGNGPVSKWFTTCLIVGAMTAGCSAEDALSPGEGRGGSSNTGSGGASNSGGASGSIGSGGTGGSGATGGGTGATGGSGGTGAT